MSKQLNREEAWALLTEYNQDPFHLHHARTVEGVMRCFAQEPVSYTHLRRSATLTSSEPWCWKKVHSNT